MKVLGTKVSEVIFKSFEQEAVNLGLTKSELLRILINRFIDIKCKKRQDKQGAES